MPRTPEQQAREIEMQRLRRQRAAAAAGKALGPRGRQKGSTHTPEARAAIREAALRRWAEIKRGKE